MPRVKIALHALTSLGYPCCDFVYPRRDAPSYALTTFDFECKAMDHHLGENGTYWSGSAADVLHTPGTNCVAVEQTTNVTVSACSGRNGDGNCTDLVKGSENPHCWIGQSKKFHERLVCDMPNTQSVVIRE